MPINESGNVPKVPQGATPEAGKVPRKRWNKSASQSGETATVPTSAAPPASVLPQAVAAALSSESQPFPEKSWRHDNPTTGPSVQESNPVKSANQEGKSVTAAAPRDANGAKPKQKHFRGRRKIRTLAQARARHNEIADKVLSGALDPKAAAIGVQAVNGVVTCLRAEQDTDFDKRMQAIEERLGKPHRGRDA